LSSKKLAIVALLSALGGLSSVAIGWGGTILSLTFLGPVSGQVLAGLHVFWLVLVAVLVENRGSATAVGALKGLVEMMLPNHLGVLVFFVSLLEGVVVDLAFLLLRRPTPLAVLLTSGFSSASNLLVLQMFQLLPASFSLTAYVAMYSTSFGSGLVLGGYLSLKSLNTLKNFVRSWKYYWTTSKVTANNGEYEFKSSGALRVSSCNGRIITGTMSGWLEASSWSPIFNPNV